MSMQSPPPRVPPLGGSRRGSVNNAGGPLGIPPIHSNESSPTSQQESSTANFAGSKQTAQSSMSLGASASNMLHNNNTNNGAVATNGRPYPIAGGNSKAGSPLHGSGSRSGSAVRRRSSFSGAANATDSSSNANPYANATVASSEAVNKERRKAEEADKERIRKAVEEGVRQRMAEEAAAKEAEEKAEKKNNKKGGSNGAGGESMGLWTRIAGVSLLVAGASVAVMGIVALDQHEQSQKDEACEQRINKYIEGDRWVLVHKEQNLTEREKVFNNLYSGYGGGDEAYEAATAKGLLLPKGRLGHAACVVAGKMYIHGGLHGIPPTPTFQGSSVVMSDIWRYDPLTKGWKELIYNSSLPNPGGRLHHSIVALKDNRTFMLVGGFNNETSRDLHDSHGDMWAFDTINMTWSEVQYNKPLTKYVHDAKEVIENSLVASEKRIFNSAKEQRLAAKTASIKAERQAAKATALKAHAERMEAIQQRNAERALRRSEREARIAAKIDEATKAVAAEEEEKKEKQKLKEEENAAAKKKNHHHGGEEEEECKEDDADCEDEEETAPSPAADDDAQQTTASKKTVNITAIEAEEPVVEDDEADEAPLNTTQYDDDSTIKVTDDVAPYRAPRTRSLYPNPRGAHEATLSADGKYIYVFGGHQQIFTEPTGELWRFELETKAWEELTPRNESFPHNPSRRVGFSWTTVGNTSYLFGGACVRGSPTESSGQCSDTWAFDQNTNKWTFINTTEPIFETGAEEEYDPSNMFSSPPSAIPYAPSSTRGATYTPRARRAGHSQVATADGTIFLFGGVYLDNTGNNPDANTLFNDLWAFVEVRDEEEKGVDEAADSKSANKNNGTAADANNAALRRRWVPITPNYGRGPKPKPTFGHSIVAIDNTLIVFGGRHTSLSHHGGNALWEYKVLKA